MEEFKINYKQLYKAYKKRLKKLHKTSSLSLDKSLELFVTRLKFVRDYFLLTESPVNADGTENYKKKIMLILRLVYKNIKLKNNFIGIVFVKL